jgi:D-alanyl-lipoteichoic acid acyltransferase DltB (MBOAT superfamily)
MLFNTSEFIFLFLPLAVTLHFWTASRNLTAAAIVTTLSSLAFYAWWNPPFVLLPILSILLNFMLARAIVTIPERGARLLMLLGVAINLMVLCYFKYEDFILAILQHRAPPSPNVPLALSFTTFVQIAFLVQLWRSRAAVEFPRYALFVSFFPHLIAGPIVRWSELGPQLADPARYKVDFRNIAVGLTVFCLGLAKKVLIADQLAPHIAPVFDAAHLHEPVTAFAAWGAAFAYSAQLYFDFSGYCDMAVGLGLLFNLRLPINFAAPFRSTNMIDLWRRWHVTLSRLLRDFVYIPMGGSKCGPLRRTFNLIMTMALGGLWHGANWTFIVWGVFNGVLLALNHFWRVIRGPRPATIFAAFFGWFATFIAFAIGMVMFRAADMTTAHRLLLAMIGLDDGVAHQDHIRVSADRWGIRHGYLPETLVHNLTGDNWSVVATLFTMVALSIALLVPDTMEIVDYHEGEPHANWRRSPGLLAWQPSAAWLLTIGGLFAAALTFFWQFNEFLYYQF